MKKQKSNIQKIKSIRKTGAGTRSSKKQRLHSTALSLINQMNENYRKQANLIPKLDKKDPLAKQKFKELDKQESQLYSKYYNLLHNNFDIEKCRANADYTDRKYKDGFCDKKYVNDLFKTMK